jgi:hypothetical protein
MSSFDIPMSVCSVLLLPMLRPLKLYLAIVVIWGSQPRFVIYFRLWLILLLSQPTTT